MREDTKRKQASADALCAEYLKAMADPLRIRIVKALQSSPLSVSDLVELLEADMSTVSHHLRVLYHANLVTNRREGKFIYYYLNEDFVREKSKSKSLDFGCCELDLDRK